MAEQLSSEDFELYYRHTFFPMKGEVYYVRGRTDDTNVSLSYGEQWEKTLVVPYKDILDYVGKFPQAGYRNFSDLDVRYVSFTRNGTKKGVSVDGVVGVNRDVNWKEIFFPKYYSVSDAMERVSRDAITAISPDLMLFKQGEKICLMWKGCCVGRVTQKHKAILCKGYAFLIPLIFSTISVGDTR